MNCCRSYARSEGYPEKTEETLMSNFRFFPVLFALHPFFYMQPMTADN